MFNCAYTFGTGFLWKLSINSFPALVCCHIHVHSTFCEWDNITLDFSDLSTNLVKQWNLPFNPYNPTITFNNTNYQLFLSWKYLTRSFFISQTFSKVLVHFSRSTGSYSTSPHSETSTQNSPLCKSTNSLFTRDVFSWSVTLYQPGSSSAYATQHDVNAITLKCRNFYFI